MSKYHVCDYWEMVPRWFRLGIVTGNAKYHGGRKFMTLQITDTTLPTTVRVGTSDTSGGAPMILTQLSQTSTTAHPASDNR